jgi:choline dehydrogenase-like flavoprotein
MKPLDYSAQNYVGRQLYTAETLADRDTRTLHREVDVAVVGAGPGGLCAAHVLAAAGMSVVVLEAGQFWPTGSFERDQTWATEHLYQEKGTRVARGNSLIPVTSGRGVGGGTLINSGISFRAPDRILDQWHEEFGVEFWAPDQREEHFREVEQTIGVETTDPEIAGGNSEVARRGFEALGVDHGYMPRSTPGCAGCGACQTGCPVGGKASADVNWLPAILRDGGELYADTRVEEILVDGDRAVGVRGTTRRPESDDHVVDIEVRADRVILACGAIYTPMMLQQQGLAASNDHVGRHLHIHPGVSAVAHMPDDVVIWNGATQGYYGHHPTNPDIIAETFSASPEMLYTPGAEIGYEGMEFLHKLRQLAGCGSVIRDESGGSVEPNGWKADITYMLDRRDCQKLREGLLFLTDMFFEAGAEQVKPFFNGADFWASRNRARTEITKADAPSDYTLYASHPLGTCRMSADPNRGVVRPSDGQLHDVDNLHITDASVFPTAPGVNPQVTIMATSLQLARGIVART